MILERLKLGPLNIGSASVENFPDWKVLESGVHPSELQASQKYKHALRKKEFLLGRWLLRQMEPTLAPLLSGEKGLPLWQAGFTGSLSHKEGRVIACIEKSERFRSLAIDLEFIEGFPVHVSSSIAKENEWEAFESCSKEFSHALLFSAKESLFKLCYPLCLKYFGFHDAEFLSFDKETGTFEIRLLKGLSQSLKLGDIFKGYFREKVWSGRKSVMTTLILS